MFRCSHFLGAPVSLSPRCKSVHVVQNEAAVVSTRNDQQVAYIGSTDATTCVIVALVDTAAGLAAVAHFDTDSAACRHSLRACLPEGMAAPVLYMVGGYADAGGAGRRTCAALLAFFHAAPQPIMLRLLCAGRLNTDPAGAPRCQSLAVCLRTGAPHPAHFPDRGPMIPQRLAQLWVRRESEPKLEHVYDTPSGRIAPSLLVGAPHHSVRRYVAFLLQLSEDDPKEFLRRISTSPDEEGPGFMQGASVGRGGWTLQRCAGLMFEPPSPIARCLHGEGPRSYASCNLSSPQYGPGTTLAAPLPTGPARSSACRNPRCWP